MMQLTPNAYHAILFSPCNGKVGFRSLFRKGDISPQSLKAVFFRQKFTHLTNLFSELSNVMVVLFGQPFWLVLPFRDTANRYFKLTQNYA